MANGIGFGRRDQAVKTVGRAAEIRSRRPRRHDAKLTIDLHGIGIDDGAPQALGKLERRSRLTARCRPGDENGFRTGLCSVAMGHFVTAVSFL